MELRKNQVLTYSCGICNSKYSQLEERHKCEGICLKKHSEQKKILENAIREKAIREIENAIDNVESLIKRFNENFTERYNIKISFTKEVLDNDYCITHIPVKNRNFMEADVSNWAEFIEELLKVFGETKNKED